MSVNNMTEKIVLNDRLVRIVGILFFGFIIPNATGLVDNLMKPIYLLILAYGYFIMIAWFIWQGNRFLLFKLQTRFDWFINPIQKVIFVLAGNVFYTSACVISTLLGWYFFVGTPPQWTVIRLTVIVCVICVIFVTHAYETVFLIKQREQDILQSEQLERAKVQAELEALKNQIDPHFMFNSLNSLSYLIEENPVKAKLFTESLAEVYRYILGNKDRKLVLLEDELGFLKQYVSLIKLRFDRSFQIAFDLEEGTSNQFLIPPISIFIAIENAVKHNEVSRDSPLLVEIKQVEGLLYIENKVTKKKTMQHSSKIGLKNLDERFSILIGKGIKTSLLKGVFKLQLPMLRLNS